jgi:toxin ParE1/3/4
MSLSIEKSLSFYADVTNQFGWYVDEAGDELAWRFFETVDMTILKLADQPDLGRIRHFRRPLLRELRSYRLNPPFQKFLIFYRSSESNLLAWRLIHGARDLPRRLLEAEPPSE